MSAQPDYTDSFPSRNARHDTCEREFRRLLAAAGLDPLPRKDPYGIDVVTRHAWQDRTLFDLKIMRSDWTVAVEGSAWHSYPADGLFIVVGLHSTGQPVMIAEIEELARRRHDRDERLPSGDWGWRFPLEPASQLVARMEQLRALAAQTNFLRDPDELHDTSWCGSCKLVLPASEFHLHRDRGRQSYCKVCDHAAGRLNLWLREGGLPKHLPPRALAEFQHDSCPTCVDPLTLDKARLRWNTETGEHLGFTHNECEWHWHGVPPITSANDGRPHLRLLEPDQLTLDAFRKDEE